jgi:hypothetical protein
MKLNLLSYPERTIQNEITTSIESKPNETKNTISMNEIFFNKWVSGFCYSIDYRFDSYEISISCQL